MSANSIIANLDLFLNKTPDSLEVIRLISGPVLDAINKNQGLIENLKILEKSGNDVARLLLISLPHSSENSLKVERDKFLLGATNYQTFTGTGKYCSLDLKWPNFEISKRSDSQACVNFTLEALFHQKKEVSIINRFMKLATNSFIRQKFLKDIVETYLEKEHGYKLKTSTVKNGERQVHARISISIHDIEIDDRNQRVAKRASGVYSYDIMPL